MDTHRGDKAAAEARADQVRADQLKAAQEREAKLKADQEKDAKAAAEAKEEAAKAAAVLKKPAMLKQHHGVHVGDRVQLNGTLFNVPTGMYDWHMVGPEGEDAMLTCDTMPSPYFTPDKVGIYEITLPTEDGMAEITVKVDKAE